MVVPRGRNSHRSRRARISPIPPMHIPCRAVAVHRAMLIAVAVLAAPTSSVITTSKNTTYVFGGWIPGTPKTISDTLEPLFEGYLNREVGQKFSPPIAFRFKAVDYSEESYSDPDIKSGALDFIYSLTGRLGCMETEFGWSPLATQRAYINGAQTGAQGSIIYSLKSNTDIQNISDFKNKRIGVGLVLSSNAYHLGYQLMANHGVNLFTDIKQLVFYGNDYDSQVRDILGGNIDVAMTASSWLYVNHPGEMPQLRVHNPMNLVYEAEDYPFLTSTELAPQFGVSVSPAVPLGVKEAVADALLRLNRSNPEAVKMSVSGFTVPTSYWRVRNLLQQLGLLKTAQAGDSGGTCIQPYESLLHTIKCPPGFVQQSEAVMERQCKKDGLPCPSGAQCFCRPCAPDHMVTIFPAKTVLVLCSVLLGLALLCSAGWVLFLETFTFTSSAVKMAHRAARHAAAVRHKPKGGRGKMCFEV